MRTICIYGHRGASYWRHAVCVGPVLEQLWPILSEGTANTSNVNSGNIVNQYLGNCILYFCLLTIINHHYPIVFEMIPITTHHLRRSYIVRSRGRCQAAKARSGVAICAGTLPWKSGALTTK